MLYTFESGATSNQSIVFLHGGGLSSKMWRPVIELLPDFYCLAPDLPEQGQSQATPFELEDASERVIELVRTKVPGQRAAFVGLSLGGAVALTVARHSPEMVDRLMVSGTSAVLGKLLGRFTLLSLGSLRLMKPETLARSMVRQMHIPSQYQELFYDDLLLGAAEPFNRRVIRSLMNQKLPEKLEAPLLVAVGQKETITAKAAARKLLSLYPQAAGIMVPRLGHVWALEDPALFAGTVRAWVQGQELPGSLQTLQPR